MFQSKLHHFGMYNFFDYITYIHYSTIDVVISGTQSDKGLKRSRAYFAMGNRFEYSSFEVEMWF